MSAVRAGNGRQAGESDDHDTVIGVGPAALVEPALDGSSILDADTIVSSPAPRAPLPPAETDRHRSPAAPASPAALPPESTVPVSTIRIGTHEPIPLDLPAYIGRRPSAPRITGGRPPRLVMVPSPAREVSATHVEIRQEGTTVVVTDLGSTNGTIITHPRGEPVALRQGESVVAVNGSVVDVGDGIQVIITEGTP